jgi:alanyl-tRNA synthetase
MPKRRRMMDYEQAIAAGAMALFGEKYDSRVRVLSIGEFSTELCGGTHVKRAGDIGIFHIVSESGVAAGVRRIEAVTGQAALDYVNRIDTLLGDIAQLVHGSPTMTATKVREALERIRALEKENRASQGQAGAGPGYAIWPRGGRGRRREGAGHARGRRRCRRAARGGRPAKEPAGIGHRRAWLGGVGFESGAGRRCHAGSDRTGKGGGTYKCVAAQVGGKGGGRADFAQAGGSKPQALDEALASVDAVGARTPGGTLMKFKVLLQRYQSRLFVAGTVVSAGQ